MKKIIKFLLNGGSAIIYTMVAVSFFSLNMSFGMSVYSYAKFIGYISVFYLGIQILQFNLAKVSTIKDAGIDFITSAIPMIYLLYVFFSKDFSYHNDVNKVIELQNDLKIYVRNIMILTIFIDLVLIGWSSLKMLLFVDKNATSGS